MKYLAFSLSNSVSASLLVRWPFRKPGFHHGAWPIGRSARSRLLPRAISLSFTRLVVPGVSAVSPAKKQETLLVSSRYILAALRHRSRPYRLPLWVADPAWILTPSTSVDSPGATGMVCRYPCFPSHFAIAGGANSGISSGNASRESNDR